jgi:hypothetical protein
MSYLSDLWPKWFGTGTADDRRNPFWRLTEYLSVKVEWHRYLIDLQLFFKREGKWTSYLAFWKPVTQNFHNGVFTFNIYVSKGEWRWDWPIIYTTVNAILIGIPYLIWGTTLIPWLCVWLLITIPCWFVHPRINIMFRPLRDWYGEFGLGILFDRGEFGLKLSIYDWKKENVESGETGTSDTRGWNEGSV